MLFILEVSLENLDIWRKFLRCWVVEELIACTRAVAFRILSSYFDVVLLASTLHDVFEHTL